MGNEKNTNAKTEGAVTAAELAEEMAKTAPATTEIVENEELDFGDGVKVELRQTPYHVNGKTLYYYHAPIIVFGKERKLEVRPKDGDVEGFMTLKDLFDDLEVRTGKREYFLTIQKKTRKDNDGKRTAFLTYEVRFDDNGLVSSVPVRPFGDSTKKLFESLYEQKTRKL